jgi:hypothetical protein
MQRSCKQQLRQRGSLIDNVLTGMCSGRTWQAGSGKPIIRLRQRILNCTGRSTGIVRRQVIKEVGNKCLKDLVISVPRSSEKRVGHKNSGNIPGLLYERSRLSLARCSRSAWALPTSRPVKMSRSKMPAPSSTSRF